MSHVRLATIAGLVLAVALGGLTGWLGFRAYESHKTEELRSLFQVGRQGALNLTTIDHQQADADVQRILDSATGTFYDDFQRRAQPVHRRRQAGAVEVGRNHQRGGPGIRVGSGDEAQVLVAVTVKTSNAGAPEQSRGPGGCGSQCRRWVTRPGRQRGVRAVTEPQSIGADDKNDSPDDTVKETTTVPVDTDTERTEEQATDKAGKGGRGGRRGRRGRGQAPHRRGRRRSPTVCCPPWRCCWPRPRVSSSGRTTRCVTPRSPASSRSRRPGTARSRCCPTSPDTVEQRLGAARDLLTGGDFRDSYTSLTNDVTW